MKTLRLTSAFAILVLLALFLYPSHSNAFDGNEFAADGLTPPPHPTTLADNNVSVGPSRYQPSAFLAGRVAVQLIFVESDGIKEASTNDWTNSQIANIQTQVTQALAWWQAHLPNARLHFDLSSQIVASDYEPINHTLSSESVWIGNTLQHIGMNGSNYFEQAYSAADSLRKTHKADWATTIFVVNSTSKGDGRFADGNFAYAYIGGPFMVVTSTAGPYGLNQMAHAVAHEFGHIFGALDQYASAAVPCTQQSGYLSVANSNSQANNCGTHFSSIMLEPITAYVAGSIDDSALGQVGYRDSDGNGVPDPLDTKPILDLRLTQASEGARPIVAGQAREQPFSSNTSQSISINTIDRIEYSADNGPWIALPPADGVYDSASEALSTQLPLYDGIHEIELRAVNSIGATSATTHATVQIQDVGPTPAYAIRVPSLYNNDSITVGIQAANANTLQISEDPFFRNVNWQAVAPKLTWIFDTTDGSHTLYIRFCDNAGIVSPTYSQSVLVDRTPPTGHALLLEHSPPQLEIQAQDDVSGIDTMQVIINGQAGEWQAFTQSSSITGSSEHILVRLQDLAGNISAPIPADTIRNIYLPITEG